MARNSRSDSRGADILYVSTALLYGALLITFPTVFESKELQDQQAMATEKQLHGDVVYDPTIPKGAANETIEVADKKA